jgi:phosphohistidine phosphatase
MEIYIVRHAIAEAVAADGSDESRSLTEEGKKKMKEAAAGFERLERRPQHIFSSPLVRARQTAEILAVSLKLRVEELKELTPAHAPKEVCEKLRQMKKLESVMLVGHEPNCSELASYLLVGAGGLNLEFKKGGICLIETPNAEPGSGDLILHLPPSALRLMAR